MIARALSEKSIGTRIVRISIAHSVSLPSSGLPVREGRVEFVQLKFDGEGRVPGQPGSYRVALPEKSNRIVGP